MGVVLPPIIYALMIYLTSPHKSINIVDGLHYVGIGAFSVIMLPFLSILLPDWNTDFISLNTFQNFFMVVAPKEELIKYLSFLILFTAKKKKDVHPLSIMFYMGMVGLGFAMVENLQYLSAYGTEVLKTRTFTSTIAHMLFGMFAGYWIALGRINTGKFGTRSVFGLLMTKSPEFKRLIYLVLGLLSAIIYHGLWNYNLKTSGNSSSTIMILMLFLGLVITKFASLDILSQHKKKIKRSTNNS